MSQFDCAVIGTVLGIVISYLIWRICFYFFGDKRPFEYEKLDLSDWVILKEYGGNEGFANYMRSDKRLYSGYHLIIEFIDDKSRKPKNMMFSNGRSISRVGFRIR